MTRSFVRAVDVSALDKVRNLFALVQLLGSMLVSHFQRGDSFVVTLGAGHASGLDRKRGTDH